MSGAGPKRHLLPLYEGVKQWFNNERQNGMFVDRGDAFFELDERIHLYYQSMEEASSSGRAMSKSQRAAMNTAHKHIRCTSHKHPLWKRNIEQKTERLMNFIRARVLKPQRLVDIDKKEERRRLEQTWKLIDERIWLVAFWVPG